MANGVPNILIIDSRFYEDIADELVKGATNVLDEAEVRHERVSVPGAFEIPAAIRYAIRARDFHATGRRFDGYIVLGCVIRGETSHFDYVCGEATRALQTVVQEYTLALGYGLLTVENEAQAWERASVDKRNKGGAAASVCLEMINLKKQFGLYPR